MTSAIRVAIQEKPCSVTEALVLSLDYREWTVVLPHVPPYNRMVFVLDDQRQADIKVESLTSRWRGLQADSVVPPYANLIQT
jgi:hypothetical protein